MLARELHPSPMRTSTKWVLFLTPISLVLFFPLFFKLNYPEIIKHGWPLTRCHILQSKILPRYCCETQCRTDCSSAPSGAQQCSVLISSIDSGFNPATCATNSSACPSGVGGACDGGYYCCSNCCQTCSNCTNTCSTSCPSSSSTCSTSCIPSCTTYSCNCSCCSNTSHRSCTLSCPSCFSVQLDLTYYTTKLALESTMYTQDFKKDNTAADNFFQAHPANSTSTCFYNSKDLTQVSFDVSFTAWKWAITAIFGMLPLLGCICGFIYLSGIPQKIWGWVSGFFKWVGAGVSSWKAKRGGSTASAATTAKLGESVGGSSNEEAPPPYKG
ncbi:hypothetical protein BDN72DRAFT_199963 [Pluteus cervinus]|uniref:Uncharacterized protein n=1 Tax=Pluteus cervinus TaxID=181527 RepID=A0ACD3B726_9AGAR|nr:hypothetical protein BDN72DRAFT_199963 [Pluteus cervinus]